MAGLIAGSVMDKARAAVAALDGHVKVEDAYVFGSHAAGVAHEWSDVDLAVFAADLPDLCLEDLLDLDELVEHAAGPEIELHLFPSSQLDSGHTTIWSRHVLETGIRVLPRS